MNVKKLDQHIRRQLKKKIASYSELLDEDAITIIQDLCNYLGALNAIEVPSPYQEELAHGVKVVEQMGFMGKGGGMMFAIYEGTLEQEMLDDLLDLQNNKKFATFSENRMYCEGTEGMLGILTRYQNIETTKAKICAFPDSQCFLGEKAKFDDDHAETLYDDQRVVYVSIVFDNGFIMFAFKETVDKKNKVRPQKVY